MYNNGMNQSKWNHPYYRAYVDQKGQSQNKRKIPFNLTFEEWLDIWQSSGKLHLRGKGKGKYNMCRIGDTGPYEVGNVFIGLHEKNSNHGKATCEWKRKPIQLNGKIYHSIKQCADQQNVSYQTIQWWIKSRKVDCSHV